MVVAERLGLPLHPATQISVVVAINSIARAPREDARRAG